MFRLLDCELIWFYYVPGSGHKYIHYDRIDVFGYMTTFGFGFMKTFSSRLYVSCFVRVSNFTMMAHNKLEKDDWRLVLRLEITTIIEPIDPYLSI